MATRKRQVYDDLAGDYDVIWKVPALTILLSLLDQQLQSLGDWKGAQVLDLACGTGIGLREARKLGATRLVGVDISSEMIGVAEANNKDLFELHVADCSQPFDHLGLQPESFDLVIAMWLLNYAQTREQGAGMWANISKYLKPGAKFVGIIETFEDLPKSVETHKYGAKMSNVERIPIGAKKHIDFDTVPKIEFDAYITDQHIFEEEARKAGLMDMRYVYPSKENVTLDEEKTAEWWRPLLDDAPNQLVIATKA